MQTIFTLVLNCASRASEETRVSKAPVGMTVCAPRLWRTRASSASAPAPGTTAAPVIQVSLLNNNGHVTGLSTTKVVRFLTYQSYHCKFNRDATSLIILESMLTTKYKPGVHVQTRSHPLYIV